MIRLELPDKSHEQQVMSFRDDFLNNGDSLNGTAGLRGFDSYDEWLVDIDLNSCEETVEEGLVPATNYLAIREEDSKLVGIIEVRHRLSDYLLQFGGHVAYCVLKSERQKGYAKMMVKMAIEEAKDIGLDRLLVCCYKDNIASAKTILANGGVLENEVIEDGDLVQRYWIEVQ